MIMTLFAAIVIAAQSPATPLPTAAAASPNIPCAGRCLAGIAIGDDKYRVLSALDSQPIPGSDERIVADFNSYPDGLMLSVYYQKSIVAVSITNTERPGASKIVDPYGVKLNDTSARLAVLRGKPDVIDGDIWRYGPADGIHWDYTVENGAVTAILLSSVDKLP